MTLDGLQYLIRVWTGFDEAPYMDITINNVVIATSLPCLVGQLVIPYAYLEGAGGNFVWSTASGDDPRYENFGGSDILLYASNAEVAAGRAANALSLNAIVLASNQAN